MPSASTKVEFQASSEALEPLKKVLTVVDKKVRNLEKRKLKLDAYKEKQDSGDVLEKDQLEAVSRYGEVVQNLEFARDLQKQFTSINVDTEKLLKKQAKRGKSEKQLQEVKRVREVLQLQGLLDSLGSEDVRKDFQTGKHGAIVLTEDNLEQLDELYKLISPTRDGETNYHESLSTAAEHVVGLLDARDKPVAGSTYKDLKELIDLIAECGYFERAPITDDGKLEETGEAEFEVVEHTDVPLADSEEVQSSLPPEVKEEPAPVVPSPQLLDTTPLSTQQQQVPSIAEADSFFSAPVPAPTVQQQAVAEAFSQRPFQDIVSSVQGSFNFLQESTIEVEAKQREFSPHMDPAVVAAHPMPSSQALVRPPSTQNPEATGLPQPGFGAPTFSDQQVMEADIAVSSHAVSQHSVAVDQTYSQAKSVQSQPDFVANSGFASNNLSHSLQTDNLFSGGSVGDKSAGNISHSVIGKGSSDAALTQFEIPPQLPMPPGHDQQTQDNQSQSQNEKKGYSMNPHASEFQSNLIYNQSVDEDESSNKQSSESSNFQEANFTNSTYQGRDQRGGRGAYRNNDRSRGNSRGGMSNGFQRSGRSNNGTYERSNSGGAGYQGYPPRDNYRSDGYQGFNSGNPGGNNFNGGYQKRSDSGRGSSRGSGGNFRGGPRGGQSYNRGGGQGYNNRSGGGGRGGSNPSFGRPNFNQQQVAQ